MNEQTSYFHVLLETTITFFVLLLFTRFLGKKQLSHLTFFNYITGITIGSLAANMIMLSSNDYLKELTALALWCLLASFIGFISQKSGKLRVILDGQPTIIIKKGKIDRKALSKTKLNVDDLTMLMRQKNLFSITEVDYAILEPNGALSILKKPDFQNVQNSDLQIKKTAPHYIPTEIIVDGKVIERNLKELGLSQEWLYKELEKARVDSIKTIIYAEVQPDGQLVIQQV